MSAPAFDQKANPNLKEIQVEHTISSEGELKRQIEQFNKEDYQETRGLSFKVPIAIVIWIIISGVIWLAWL